MTDSVLGLLGFGLTFLAVMVVVGAAFVYRKNLPPLRVIPSFGRLHQAIGRVVEDGSRLHVSLGRGMLITPQSASAFAGLTLLRRLANLTIMSDRPPVTVSGDPALTLLAQDTLWNVAREANLPYDPTAARLGGMTPFSYAAGSIPSILHENVSAVVLIGNFGPEAALLADAAERSQAFCIAGSDNLTAQSILYAAAQEPLIGEELYASGAYIEPTTLHAVSLMAQDVLRWLLIVAMIGGSVLTLIGVL
ncbi:MAG: hypothetical protein N2049_00815 [Anaerolineales bacterium]|nr:hypothetical protein [Anaerolineales bacterium]